MASKGASSRAAARKQKDKWKAKRWYNIRAPRQPWNFKIIGETLGEEDELLIGRMYEMTQQELDGDFSKMNVKIKFRVTEIIGQDAITEFAGHEVLKDHVRRQVRRYRGKIDDVIDAITDDGYYVRLKPFIVTQNRVKTSQKQAVRDACRNILLQTAASNTWVSLQKMILSGELEQQIELLKICRKYRNVEMGPELELVAKKCRDMKFLKKDDKRERTNDDLFDEIMKIEHKKQMELKKNGSK